MPDARQIDCEALLGLAEHHPGEVAVILEMLAEIDESCGDGVVRTQGRHDEGA